MDEPTPRRADRHRKSDRPHRGSLVVLLAAFLVLVGGLATAGVYYGHCEGAVGDRRPVTFTVAEGTSGTQVVDDLAAKGVIPCGGMVGRWLLQRNGRAGEILSGTYDLTTGMTLNEAISVITTPPLDAATTEVTIPEGYRITQIADVLSKRLHISASGFTQLALGGGYSDPPYLKDGQPVEGFLFPDTYEFTTVGTTADDVIRKMLDRFTSEAKALPFDSAKSLGVTPYQIVIIASMIEREARVPKDRALISAVIYNRLKDRMTLGIDATLLYADPTPDGELSSSDLLYDTPYNTRVHAGLPPTPIASPGRASLMAALDPAHVNYLYYVLCGADGHHRFTASYQRFLSDQAHCLG